jgi:subtilase family protein
MPDHRIAARGLVCLAALALLLITAPPVLAQPTLDDGKPGPGARWDPGMLLVKLRPGITPSHLQRLLHHLGLRQVDHLPLVPDLFEVRVPPGTHVLVAQRKLGRQPEVLYTQPNYDETETPDAGPSQASYWPTDPLFWPAKWKIAPPKRCNEPDRLGQWPLWQLGHNLTDARDPAQEAVDPVTGKPFNPLKLPTSEDPGFPPADVDGGLVQYEQYHSINVLPVWNLLRDQGWLSGPGTHGWETKDIQRSGIAVQDTGLSNAPDIAPQIAALFSTVSSTESARETIKRDRVREVYRDNPQRGDPKLGDLETVKDAFEHDPELKGRNIDFGFTNRPLFALDDTGLLRPNENSDPKMPTGCDGHGTAVASVADAKAYNNTGIAGVAYNVPLIGLRPGEYWDRPGKTEQAKDDRIGDALDTSKTWWHSQAEYTTKNIIEQLLIVRALQIPVLNMSYSRDLFTTAEPPVVNDPALAEALLRTLATGKTLGVASAGNESQQYGSPGNPAGTGERAPRAPCGIKLIRDYDALVPGGKTFSATAFPGREREPNWSDVNLLCVAASNQYGSRLARFSGSGDAAVDLAAPGVDITALARPVVSGGKAEAAYEVVNGTSFAAPMVAGAAALLREAAPDAPIAEIKAALETGARKNTFLDGEGRVLDGSLDVACALSALGERAKQRAKQRDWDLVSLDEKRYPDFANATRDCGGKPRYVEETTHKVSAEYLKEQGTTTLSALIDASKLSDSATSPSRKWQERLLGKQEARRVAFTPAGTDVVPADVKDRVYNAGRATVGCIDPGFQITGVIVSVKEVGAPQLWYFPTDVQPRRNWIEVALALARPLSSKSLTIQLRAFCDQFPSIPR